MEFGNDNEIKGGGGLATGLAMGSMMNRRDDDRGTYIWAVIIFIIFVVIALVFLAFMRKDDGRKDYGGTDAAALLTPLIAAKSMDCNNGHNRCELDKLEIMQKLEASEDRARQTQTQQEIGALGKEFTNIGFGLASKIDNVEKEQLKTYATIQNQLGMQSEALKQLLTVQNNSAIINGVIQQLMMGSPCLPARC